jgi:ParB family chromosome partitioning protein
MVEREDDLQTFLLAFYDNLPTREFCLLEKAEILSRLKRFGEKESKIIRHYFPQLNIPQTSYYLQLYLAISRFPKEIKAFIHKRNMSLTSLEYLAQFSPKERKLLLSLLQPLGQNKQKELLENLVGISLREDLPAEKILMEEEMVKIRRSEKLSSLQKSERIRRMLRRRRYPYLSWRREAFQRALEKSGCPENISIDPSPYFEEEEMTLRFRFKNEEGFRSHIRQLQKLGSKKEFLKVFQGTGDE